MFWLRIALVSEGASDDMFLPPIMERSALELCPDNARVEEILRLRVCTGPPSLKDTVQALAKDEGAFTLVVFHHDGDGDPQTTRERYVDRFENLWREAGHREPVVGLVPVRETETWALADPGALWTVLGRPSGDSGFGLPNRGVELEKIRDPKSVLGKLYAQRNRRWQPRDLELLGEVARLERLRELPSFRRWEDDLAEALRTLPGFAKG